MVDSMSNIRNEDQEEVVKRLDAILSVLLETNRPGGKEIPMARRVKILYEAGLRPVEISRILGWGLSSITSEIARIRKSKKKKHMK